jgi:hypothetical protein
VDEMPYKIVKKEGKRKWKIVRMERGHTKTVGSSTSKRMAKLALKARYVHEKDNIR